MLRRPHATGVRPDAAVTLALYIRGQAPRLPLTLALTLTPTLALALTPALALTLALTLTLTLTLAPALTLTPALTLARQAPRAVRLRDSGEG